jgi:phage major head subunit gpT-like protein
MSTPASYVSQVPANTEYLGLASAIFDAKKDMSWTAFSEVVPCPGVALELDAIGPSPAVRLMTGQRRFANFRAYVRSVLVRTYSADAIELSRIVVNGDKSGAVTRRLSDYLARVSNFLEKPVVDKLLSNPVGIDNVSLFNNSHPFGSAGGTWDNLTTDALSANALDAGYIAMRGLKDEFGEPMGIRPTHLVVSPKNERAAFTLIGANRIVPVSSAGVLDAAAAVVAAVSHESYLQGQLQLIVLDRMADGTHDDDWFLMDLSKPGVKPIIVGENRGPQGVVVDDPQSEPVIHRAAYQYYVDADAAISGYCPHVVYGKIT